MSTTSDDDTLRDLAMEVSDLLVECGFNKPIMSLTTEEIPHLVQTVANNAVLLKVKGEPDQFNAGLEESPVLFLSGSFHIYFTPCLLLQKRIV